MTTRWAATVGTILIVSLASAGCGSSPSAPSSTPSPRPAPTPAPTPAPSASDAVSFVSLQPAAGTTLALGTTVTFTATISYTLARADSGSIALVIQNQDDKPIQGGGPNFSTQTVPRGSDQITLSQSIALPTSGITSVTVYGALFPQGATNSSAATHRDYRVQ